MKSLCKAQQIVVDYHLTAQLFVSENMKSVGSIKEVTLIEYKVFLWF